MLTSCQNHISHEKQSADHKEIKKAPTPKLIKDGAPSGPPPSFFQKVIPKFEPFSHYGNPESYAVDGKSYSVMTSASGYKARGLASWYGTKFHSQRTSSGEHYDMYAMTAAHRTLPLPTYIKVKNLHNGKEAIVKVNDRGPFHSSRIIDLSYAAASKLGILPKGTAPVEIVALTVGTKKQVSVAHYYVQVGGVQFLQGLAQNLRTKLLRLTKARVIVEKYQKHFIVKIGPIASKSQSSDLRVEIE